MSSDDDKTKAVTVLSKGTVINHYLIVEKTSFPDMGKRIYEVLNDLKYQKKKVCICLMRL